MSVRKRRAVMALAGVSWAVALSLAGVGLAGSWSDLGEIKLLCIVLLTSFFAVILTLAALLGHVLAPLADSREIGVRAAFRAAMPPPQGRHARELADGGASAPAKVYHFPRRLLLPI